MWMVLLPLKKSATTRLFPAGNRFGHRPFAQSPATEAIQTGGSFRLQLREQDDIPDAFLAEQHHAEAVDADADAAGGGHAVFEGDEKIFIQLLLFAAGLVFQRGRAARIGSFCSV